MTKKHNAAIRDYWDARARENAVWYVDTSCDPSNPDLEAFFRNGEDVFRQAYLDAPIRPAGKGLAVEIGPGLGRVCAAMAPHFERVVGVDVSQEMIERAGQFVKHQNVVFRVGNGEDLRQLSDGSADFVLTFTVLQHLPSRALVEGYLRESGRVLRTGGVLAAQWNNTPRPLLWRVRSRWWAVLRRLGHHRALVTREAPFAGTRVSLKHVDRALRGAGMRIVSTKQLDTLFAWVWAEKL